MTKLLIVESPAKAKTIGKYLGKDFRVAASVGHVVDLPPKSLGVDIDHDFKPEYEVMAKKKDAVTRLKQAAKGVDEIFLAPDPDREGEAIAWHIADLLRSAKKPMRRVLINEITQAAVQKAIAEAGQLNQDLFEAQQARRILDRLVGYLISPLISKKFRSGLSAGRVQSVALRLVVDRENAIRAFRKKEYWSIEADLLAELPPPFTARLVAIGEKPLDLPERFDKNLNQYLAIDQSKNTFVPDEAAAQKIIHDLAGKPFVVAGVDTQERKRNPQPPFITSTLQQEAARKLRFPAKRTMALAQGLYEGQDVGQGPVGLITYMRTDSPRVSNQALDMVRNYIQKTYGDLYLPKSPVHYKSKKSAQEAHEAIRPTMIELTPDKVKPFLEPDMYRLYELIFLRFAASQMKPAIYDQTTVELPVGDYLFRANGRVLKFKGFLAAYEEATDDKKTTEEDRLLPTLAPGQKLKVEQLGPKPHFTEPPPRFTEASLVKELEERGIGRPSTYAQILSTIQDRKYVQKDQGQFLPTPLGERITEILVKAFPDILNAGFTAKMEEDLDRIEEGQQNWVALLHSFYGPFSKRLIEAKKIIFEDNSAAPTDLPCPLCGKELMIKWGKTGEFLGCSAYPECNFTANFTKDEKGEIKIEAREALAADTGIKCELCGKPLTIKKTRKGGLEFLACTGYPECKNAMNFTRGENGEIKPVPRAQSEDPGIACDKCGKPMVIRRTKKGGREFLACSGYPACKNAGDFIRDESGKIIRVHVGDQGPACDKCGKPLVLKRSKFNTFWGCSGYPECDNILNLAEVHTITKKAEPGEKKAAPAEKKAAAPKAKAQASAKTATETPTNTEAASDAPVCDKCGKPMRARRGRTGSFWGCTGYPNCKNTKPMSQETQDAQPKSAGAAPLPDEPPCEKCGQPMVMRNGRFGPFISCSGFPKCKNIRKKKPGEKK